MKTDQKFLLIWAIFTVSYILITAAIHWFLDSDVFVIAVGLCGIVFMIQYSNLIHISPLDRSIGRLEGEQKCLVKIRAILKKKRK